MSISLRLLIIIAYPFLFNLITFAFGAMVVGDTLQQYQIFKYVHNFFDYYSKFPQWLSNLNYGINGFHLYGTAGSLGTFFSVISGFFNINSYISFLFYISFLHSIFLYGLHLNTKSKDVALFFFISNLAMITDINLVNGYHGVQFYYLIPYLYYYIKKYFEYFDISSLIKAIAIMGMGFINHSTYLQIPVFYMFFLIFLLHLTFNLKKTFQKLIIFFSGKTVFYFYKLKLFSLISKKNFLILSSIVILVFFYKMFIDHLQATTFSVVPYRGYEGDMLKVSFDIFQNYGRISYMQIFREFFNGPIDTGRLIPTTFGIAGFFILFFTFYRIRNFLRNKDFVVIGTLIFIITIFSLFNIDYIDKFIYNLPFFDYYRHKTNILSLAYPFYLLLFYKIFSSKILVFDCKKKYFIIFIILFYILFIHLLFGKNISIFNIILQVSFLFCFLNYFKKSFFNKFYFIIANFILITIHIYSLSNFIYSDKEAFKINNKIHYSEKINFSKQNHLNCISELSYQKKYSAIIDPVIGKFTHNWTTADLLLLTEEVPCSTFLRFYKWNSYGIWRSKNNNNFPIFSKNFIINKIEDTQYVISVNEENKNNYKGVLPIAFDKNWSLKDKNKKSYELINNRGFLEINLMSDAPLLNLKYSNTALYIFSIFMFINGFFIVLFFYFIIIKYFLKNFFKIIKKNQFNY
jgi:hypothetical protein